MCRCSSLRRNADDLRKSLESIVVPLFCISQLAADEDRQNKLKKVPLRSYYGVLWWACLFVCEVSFYIHDRPLTGINVVAGFCVLNLQIKLWYFLLFWSVASTTEKLKPVLFIQDGPKSWTSLTHHIDVTIQDRMNILLKSVSFYLEWVQRYVVWKRCSCLGATQCNIVDNNALLKCFFANAAVLELHRSTHYCTTIYNINIQNISSSRLYNWCKV